MDKLEINNTERALERLEVRFAFQERLTQELSDQVYQLHQVIHRLRAEIEELKNQNQSNKESDLIGPAMDPPPHY